MTWRPRPICAKVQHSAPSSQQKKIQKKRTSDILGGNHHLWVGGKNANTGQIRNHVTVWGKIGSNLKDLKTSLVGFADWFSNTFRHFWFEVPFAARKIRQTYDFLKMIPKRSENIYFFKKKSKIRTAFGHIEMGTVWSAVRKNWRIWNSDLEMRGWDGPPTRGLGWWTRDCRSGWAAGTPRGRPRGQAAVRGELYLDLYVGNFLTKTSKIAVGSWISYFEAE